ncbi:MAG: alpha/beta hydrolase [Anaerolineae bacterium]|nr:alpha/beta hydrolase [Anaerolineae bacterium]
MKWLKRTGLGFIALIALMVVSGLLYQSTSAARDAEQYPPPGELVDVGGYRLHLDCAGEGSPTIVVDTGTGTWSLMWLHLMPELATRSRVCLYDRAGYGWSDASGKPHTAINSAEDLHTLLTNAHIEPPYLLVGHSYGGYTVRVFHDLYPDSVVGMVLAEAAHPEQWDRLPHAFVDGANQQVQLLRLMQQLAPLGVPRLLAPDDPYLSTEFQPEYHAAMSLSRSYEAIASEFGLAALSGEQAGATRDLGDKPLAVITAQNSLQAFAALIPDLPFDEANTVWRTLQTEMVSLSTHSTHLISETGNHYIAATDPGIVLDGVDWVLAQLKP